MSSLTPPPQPSHGSLAEDPDKGTQWNVFQSRTRLDVGGLGLTRIIRQIRLFLMPPTIAAVNGQEFEETWPAGGPWGAAK